MIGFQFAIAADVLAPRGFVRMTMRYRPGYDQGGADHQLLFFDADNLLYWRHADAKMVWRIGADDGAQELTSDALTFAAGQELTVEVEHRAGRRMIRIDGATTGNSRHVADPLPPMRLPSIAYVLGFEDGGASVLRALAPDLQTFAQLVDDRTLVQLDDTDGNRNFRDLMPIFAAEAARFRDVAMTVRSAFDIESAVGAQLDMIGSVVSLSRDGADDDRYRVLLDIQTELLLSSERDDGEWTGTCENIIRIARKFVGTNVPPGGVVLINIPPYDYLLTLTVVLGAISMADLQQLMRFLRLAAYAAVRGVAIAAGDAWGAVGLVIPHAGTWGSASVNVSSASAWGMAVES